LSFTEQQKEWIRATVRNELRIILDKGLMYSAEAKPQPQKMKVATLQDFPEELQEYLTISADMIETKFVSKEKWNQINDVAKGLGYKWVSDGKNSRWEK